MCYIGFYFPFFLFPNMYKTKVCMEIIEFSSKKNNILETKFYKKKIFVFLFLLLIWFQILILNSIKQ